MLFLVHFIMINSLKFIDFFVYITYLSFFYFFFIILHKIFILLGNLMFLLNFYHRFVFWYILIFCHILIPKSSLWFYNVEIHLIRSSYKTSDLFSLFLIFRIMYTYFYLKTMFFSRRQFTRQ